MASMGRIVTGVLAIGLVVAFVRQGRNHATQHATVAGAAASGAPTRRAGSNLAHARQTFRTQYARVSSTRSPLPNPPADLFVRTDYRSAPNLVLPAFVTPDPRDGQRHPAIIWLTGGDSNSLDDFWSPGFDSNDESAHAFRDAGLVMMFPTLRGGNDNPSMKEYFFGEVDDVLAAADHLAQLPYVDPSRIYLGGHSTGGTLVLLTSETSGRFKAVFAFGPVARIDRYPQSLIPVYFGSPSDREVRLRSPIHWLGDIASPTYLIEGRDEPSNAADVEEMCQSARNDQLHCILVRGSNHFSVLALVTRTIAARIASSDPETLLLRPDEFP